MQSRTTVITIACTLMLAAATAFGLPPSRTFPTSHTKVARASQPRPEARASRSELDEMIKDLEAGKTVDQRRLLRVLRGTHK